jgi:hypothetical protein
MSAFARLGPAHVQIKAADDKQPLISAMEALLARPDVDDSMRARIDQQIRMESAGWKAERDAAYEIEFHFGHSANHATIHDLRLELDGHVAQIDHVVINRLLQVWVCESKSYNSGATINAYGEWSTSFNGRKIGLPSPIEQNRRHIALLERVFDADICPVPRRFGQRLMPALYGLVIVGNHGRINRPRTPVEGLQTVIKAEKLRRTIDLQLDDRVRRMLRLVSPTELERFASDLATLHRPAPIDVAARFGLPPVPATTGAASRAAAAAGHARGDRSCERCRRPMSKQEAWFCRFNKARFSGGYYCIDCQHNVGVSVWARQQDSRTTIQR